MTPSAKISAAILAIRAKAGNPNTCCPTCGNAPEAPFRRFDERGEVIVGCVDAIHEGNLSVPSFSADFHRKAISVRRATLVNLKALNR